MDISIKRPRILFLINSLAGGGAERVMLSIIESSHDFLEQYDIALALLDDETRDYQPPVWLRLHQLNARSKLIKSIVELNRLCANENPDLIISFLTRSNISSTIVSKLRRNFVVISERANTSGHFKPNLSGLIAKLLIRTLYPRADRVIAPSKGIADDLATAFGVKDSRIDTIANPVNLARIQTLAREAAVLSCEAPYAVAVSRLTDGKNVQLLLRALAASGTNLSLVVLGQGPKRDELVELAASIGIADRVFFPGFVANPYPIIHSAACYLSASNGEGFPNGLVEALSLGVPAVMTNCPSGPSEILADLPREAVSGLTIAQNGILVPQNDVEGFAQAIVSIQQQDLQERYRSAGPRRAADFAVETARDRYWGVIQSALKGVKI